MRLCMLVAMVVLGGAGVARADAKGEVTAAFGAFIDGVATGKGSLAGIDVFIPPDALETEDDLISVRVPKDLSATQAMIASSKLKVLEVVVSKGGKSAWIAGDVNGRVERKGRKQAEPIRVSAFLVNDGKAWSVKATHWSTGERDVATEMCGSMEPWQVTPSIPKDAEPTVNALYEALEGDFMTEGGVKQTAARFAKLLSTDKHAVAIGSAPKEVFVGGAKIKSVFKNWAISAWQGEAGKHYARAALGPDGEMMFIAMGITAPPQLCTSYRTLFVLAKERGGWKIVHHHYSQPVHAS